jgi:preprotein translocase subunit SecG
MQNVARREGSGGNAIPAVPVNRRERLTGPGIGGGGWVSDIIPPFQERSHPFGGIVKNYLSIAQIILGAVLIAAIIFQSKEAGLGGLTGGDSGGVFRARRGVEKALFNGTIVLSILFFALSFITVLAFR